VALVARTGAALEELAQEVETRHGVIAHVLPIDLGRPHGPAQAIGELATRGVGVDALVNCAGSSLVGPFAESDELRVLEGMQVNLTALTHLTRLVLPGMIRRRWGRIVTLSSSAAFRPGPMMAQVQACRAYALSLSMALAEELRGTGVRVTALCPAPARVGLHVAAIDGSGPSPDPGWPDPAEVATWGYAQVKRGRPYAVQGPRWRSLTFGARYLPLWAVWRGRRIDPLVRGLPAYQRPG
jgi:short-subunit dehydrogenase